MDDEDNNGQVRRKILAHLTLIVGGMRSGKSRWAEQLAAKAPPVVYLATAQLWDRDSQGEAADAEMAERIQRHRQRRLEQHPDWQTVEESWDVPAVLQQCQGAGCVLLECLTLWLTNLMIGIDQRGGLSDAEIRIRIQDLLTVSQNMAARVLVVSNEVGCGVIPDNVLARRFADLLGEANQTSAAQAVEVYGCVAGLPLRLKPTW